MWRLLTETNLEGDAPWKCFKTSLDEEVDDAAPNWRKQEYEIWYRDPEVVARNMLANPDFDQEIDYAAYVELDANGTRLCSDFMSGAFAWRQSVYFFFTSCIVELTYSLGYHLRRKPG